MSEEPTTGPAVSEQVERLWEHYQTPRPNPNQWPQELTPMRAYDWNGEILRLELTAQVRAVAFALSWLGNADGGNVMPADPRLAASTGLSRRQLIEHVDVLRDLRLLHRVQRAGGRTGRVCDLYQLCVPADLGTLPFRVDGDFRPLRERTAGEAPVKAIAASKAARAARAAERDARFDVKAASPQTGAPLTHDVKPTSLGTDVAPSFEVKPPSRQSPVDNHFEVKGTSPQSPVDNPFEVKAPSPEKPFEVKPSTLSSEAQRTLECSPAHFGVQPGFTLRL